MCRTIVAEHTGHGEHQGQAALWGQPSRRLQKTSDRSVSSIVCVVKTIWAPVSVSVLAVCWRFIVLLNHDHRAVEFFIRDKYEKRIYYSKNVTNGSSVCTGSRSKFFYKCWGYFIHVHSSCLFIFSQKMLRRKERGILTEGAKCRRTARWPDEMRACFFTHTHSFSSLMYCFITSEWGVQARPQNQPRQDLRALREPTRPW